MAKVKGKVQATAQDHQKTQAHLSITTTTKFLSSFEGADSLSGFVAVDLVFVWYRGLARS